MTTRRPERGFTLVEVLIAMALITVISVFMLSSLGPWLSFKQKLDNERKLMEVKSIFSLIYERNAMVMEGNPGPVFTFAIPPSGTGTLVSSPMNGSECVSQAAALAPISQYFSDGFPAAEQDGYGNTFCILISPQVSAVFNGATLYYHNIAIVSMGKNGQKAPGTLIDATGALTLADDDTGVLINGFPIQQKKYAETAARLARVASLYETYFTTRFLSNAARDVSIDYFATSNPSGNWDGPVGPPNVSGTGDGFQPVTNVLLGPFGLGPEEVKSAYEANNDLFVGNYAGTAPGVAGATIRSSAGGGSPPFTAVLYAPLPGPNNSLIKVATGNY